MDKIKAFLKKKKVDKSFKQAGPGRALHDAQVGQPGGSGQSPKHVQQFQPQKAPPRSDPSAIAEAALKRQAKNTPSQVELTPMQKIIKIQAKRELEEEQRKLAQQTEKLRIDNSNSNKKIVQPTVLYTCELFGEDEALPKAEMMGTIESCLFEQMEDEDADPLYTSTCIIFTLNKEDVRTAALETIQRYLQNVIQNPDDAKFRRIRLSNKVFMEKIAPCKGAFEFLKAAGFKPESAAEEGENFLVMQQVNIDSLIGALDVLANGKAIAVRVFRDRKVFYLDPSSPMPSGPLIPDDFFSRSAENIRREQQQRAEALEKLTTLRTQKMREKDAAAARSAVVYKYTFIRVRFPNNYLLQGVFNVFEKFQALREFICKNLSTEAGTFTLAGPSTASGDADHLEASTLMELGLVPSALLFFEWDGPTLAHFNANPPTTYLQKELEQAATKLN